MNTAAHEKRFDHSNPNVCAGGEQVAMFEYGSMWETATDIDEHDEDYGLRAWNQGVMRALHPGIAAASRASSCAWTTAGATGASGSAAASRASSGAWAQAPTAAAAAAAGATAGSVGSAAASRATSGGWGRAVTAVNGALPTGLPPAAAASAQLQ